MHPERPSSDRLEFLMVGEPASLQAASEKKRRLTELVQTELGAAQYLLTGEVSVVIEWTVNPHLRYETLIAPDVDNIIKSIIDALSGPAGILVNDCQVQHVASSWIDTSTDEQRLRVEIRHSPDEWMPKDGLAFVLLSGRLCWPIHLNMNPEWVAATLSQLESMLRLFEDSVARGIPRDVAHLVLPAQQPFHSGRLGGFSVLTPSDIRQRLGI